MGIYCVRIGSSFAHDAYALYGLACVTAAHVSAAWSLNDSKSTQLWKTCDVSIKFCQIFETHFYGQWVFSFFLYLLHCLAFATTHLAFQFYLFSILRLQKLNCIQMKLNYVEQIEGESQKTYLRCRPHGHVFAGQFVGRVSIRWDHIWHKLMDVHFRIVVFPVELPTDCWRIGNYCVNSTFCRRPIHSIWPRKTNTILISH